MKKVIIGSDHGAIELKTKVADYLKSKGYDTDVRGPMSEESVDYPDIAKECCNDFLKGGYDFGVLLCGTGIGISISANKVTGIRCGLIHDLFTAEMSKAHNNANFIAFGGRIDYQVPVEQMIQKFIDTKFEGGRHQRRVNKISDLDLGSGKVGYC
ncbi:MAG: ribose 5-phosphate isomerase B [Spirochaetia bacterium]